MVVVVVVVVVVVAKFVGRLESVTLVLSLDVPGAEERC